MIPDGYEELVDELTKKTLDGSVHWKATMNNREFLVYFDEFALSMRDGTNDEQDWYVAVTLKNKTGKNIDSFIVWDSEPGYQKLSALHYSARRKALNIDGALKSIVGELRTKARIGEEPPATDEDEEVPF
jgi:hypothetical protein